MTKIDIKEKLKDIICDYVEVDRNDLTEQMNFTSDMGIDSFGLISLINSIEQSFAISIPDRELVNFKTMNDLVDYIAVTA